MRYLGEKLFWGRAGFALYLIKSLLKFTSGRDKKILHSRQLELRFAIAICNSRLWIIVSEQSQQGDDA